MLIDAPRFYCTVQGASLVCLYLLLSKVTKPYSFAITSIRIFWKRISSTSCFCDLLFILGKDMDTNCTQYKIILLFEVYACPVTSKETLLLFSF